MAHAVMRRSGQVERGVDGAGGSEVVVVSYKK